MHEHENKTNTNGKGRHRVGLRDLSVTGGRVLVKVFVTSFTVDRASVGLFTEPHPYSPVAVIKHRDGLVKCSLSFPAQDLVRMSLKQPEDEAERRQAKQTNDDDKSKPCRR